MPPLVSVIVPTKNSSEFLDACLASVKNQTYQNIELIVVDNNSTDATKGIASKYTDKVFNHGPERSAQRNFGAKQSQGEYVLFIDSDMEVGKEVVEECVKKAQDTGAAGIIISEESFGKGFWAQCKKLEKSFYVGVDAVEAARFFHKADFDVVNGYNETLISGEDWDLSDRIEMRGRLARISSFIRHNEGNINLRQTLKKKYYYAQKASGYIAHSSGIQTAKKRRQGIIGRYIIFFKHPVKLFKNPIIGIGMLFMKTCEFAAGAFGYSNSRHSTSKKILVMKRPYAQDGMGTGVAVIGDRITTELETAGFSCTYQTKKYLGISFYGTFLSIIVYDFFAPFCLLSRQYFTRAKIDEVLYIEPAQAPTLILAKILLRPKRITVIVKRVC